MSILKLKKIIVSICLLLISSISISSTLLTAPTIFKESNTGSWVALEKAILNTKSKRIFIFWQGLGGQTNMMEDFMTVMAEVQARGVKITFVLTGESYSAYAYTACYADYLLNLDKYFLMFHPVADSFGHPITDYRTLRHFKWVATPCIDKRILTSKDLNKALTYEEVYVILKNGKYTKYYTLDRRIK